MSEKKNRVKEGMVLAFGELFLKSEGVRNLLRRKLVSNLRHFLEKAEVDFKIFSWRERIFVQTADSDKAARVLARVFGLAWFAPAFFFENGSLSEVEKFVNKNYGRWIEKEETFALRLKRGVKQGRGRRKIIKRIAAGIDREVDLEKPEKEIFVEKRRYGWFVYFEKREAAGGLPAQSQGRVLSLISGGIDSPVAGWLAAKRGAENVWLHFHSFPLVSKASIEKVRDLARVFSDYQPGVEVCFIPFAELQKKIKLNTPPEYMTLLYRRFMFRIADRLGEKKDCSALVTGECLGQVSSQTLTNMRITSRGVETPVLRPLVGLDKREIIALAKRIGTYRISIKPQEDCCTLFVPDHQTAEGDPETVEKLETGLEMEGLISEALNQAQTEKF